MHSIRTTLFIIPTILLGACGGGGGGNDDRETAFAGSPGYGMLSSVTFEPPGANCATGGSKTDAGPDLNRNGALDPGEVTSTQYACNDAAGPAGRAGAQGIGTARPPGTVGSTGADGAQGSPGATTPVGADRTQRAAGPTALVGGAGLPGMLLPMPSAR